MYKVISFAAFFIISVQLTAQYKNDNVLYKTVYPEDLGKHLKANPGYLLLDVRSKGENEDTSSFGLNIGRFKNAKNIDIRQLPTRLNELQGFKDAPVFVYCSHSQRSRRASKMLADSGFTNVYNINGGMTALIQADYGLNDIYETKDKFDFISPAEFCNKLNNKNIFILDVRTDSSYNATTADEQDNAIGKFKNANHIPFSDIKTSLSKIPKERTIIIIDAYGSESVKAANLLAANGYNHLSLLFDGMYNLISASDISCKNQVWQQNRKYKTITADEFNNMSGKEITVLDIRNKEEFDNQSKLQFRNTGQIKHAINIPANELSTRLSELSAYKNKPLIIYSLSSHVEAYQAAATLTANGFNNVNILAGGIFNLRWRAANIKGKEKLKDWVVDIPAENL